MEERAFQGRVRNGRSCGLQPPRSSSRAAPAKTPPRLKPALMTMLSTALQRRSSRSGPKEPLNRPLPDRGLCQPVGFGIIFAGNVRDGKIQAPRQLAAGPVQGI